MAVRGISVGGKVTNGLMSMIPYMADFALAAWTGGGWGAAKGGSAVAAKGTAAAVAKTAGGAATKGLPSRGAGHLGKWALSATNTLANPVMYPRLLNYTGQNMLNDQVFLTDKGALLYKDAQTSPASAFVRATGQLWLEIFAESGGEFLFDPLAKGILGKINPAVVKNFQQAVKKTGAGKAYEFLKKSGQSNILSEYGEEQLEAVLKAVFNLDENKEYTFDDLGRAMFPDNWEDVLVTLGVLSVPGMVSTGSMALVARTARGMEKRNGRPPTEKEMLGIVDNVRGIPESKVDELNRRWERKETAEDIAAFEESFGGYREEMRAAGLTDKEVDSNSLLIQNFVEASAYKTGRTRTEILNGWLGDNGQQSLKVPNIVADATSSVSTPLAEGQGTLDMGVRLAA
ncbi:hypothetical protein NO2_0500 [Candidatus Termititenax persephonae]|uniref:Uncharacterized protein n=1 Tax=Candidatus Termititenax persephonae TaxID=2218525 RepID=A0A388TFM8_9BACT|nr:hypothetical protein NO2_0500 [Candidatus Termititenax persephonae]